MAEDGAAISFTLYLANGVVACNPKKLLVVTTKGTTLLEALRAHSQKSNNEFTFNIKKNVDVGRYVVEVNGTRNQANQFWEALLVNRQDDIVPINLSYEVSDQDVVYLQFTPLIVCRA